MVGLGAYHIVNGGYDAAKLMADELSCVCEMRPNPAARAQACLMAGVSKLFKGELGAALASLEQALALHDPEQPRPPRALMDTGVAAQSFRGLTLWLLGEPALAADAVTQALALGARQSVLHAECMAMTWASLVFGLCGDLEESRKQAERGMKLSAQYDLALCEQTVKLHWGAVCIAQGELELGIGVIGEALAAAESSGARLGSSAWHWMLAEAHAASGRVDEALLQLGHAFSRVRAAGERWWEPELYRALGTILLASSNAELPNECQAALAGGVASAEWCFARALDLSLGMRAHALELRARHSLALSVRARASARLEDEG
jgi:predicted ATPase